MPEEPERQLDAEASSVVNEYINALNNWRNFDVSTEQGSYDRFRELIRTIIRLRARVEDAIFGAYDHREIGPVRQQANSIANTVREEEGLARFGMGDETEVWPTWELRSGFTDPNIVYPEPGDRIEHHRPISELEDTEIVALSSKIFGAEVKSLRQVADRRDISVTDALRQSIITQNWLDKETSRGWTMILEKPKKRRRRVVFR